MSTSILNKHEKDLLDILPKNLSNNFEQDQHLLSSFVLSIIRNTLDSDDLDQLEQIRFVLNNTKEFFLDDNIQKMLDDNSLTWEEFFTVSELLLHTEKKNYFEKQINIGNRTELYILPRINMNISEEKKTIYKNKLRELTFPKKDQKILLERIVKILISKRNELSMDFKTYSLLNEKFYSDSRFSLLEQNKEFGTILSGLRPIFNIQIINGSNRHFKGKFDYVIKMNENYPIFLKLSVSGLTVNQEQKELFSNIQKEIDEEWITTDERKIDYYRAKLQEEKEEMEKGGGIITKVVNTNEIDYDLERKLPILRTIDRIKALIETRELIIVPEYNLNLRELFHHELLTDYFTINPNGTINYSLSLLGPRLINDPDWGWIDIGDESFENYEQSFVNVDHPFIKYTEFKVGTSNTDEIDSIEITVTTDTREEDVNKAIQSFLENFTYIEEPSKRIFIIENKFRIEFEKWVNDRKNELMLGKNLEYLFPLISENNFIDKIDELKALGEAIIAESSNLKSAILTLQNPEFDFIRIKNILRNLHQTSGEREFERSQIVESWIREINRMDTQNTYADSYLRKNIINPRLTNIIKKLDSKEIEDNEISIVRIKTPGRAKILVRWDSEF